MTAITGRSQSEAITLRHLTIRLQISLAALAFILVFAQVGSASIAGSISGIVKDPSGAVIPAASVVALNTRTGVRQTTTTDSDGFYSFPELPIGDYTISIESSGFRPYKQTGLVIDISTALRVDITLEIGTVSQAVTVSSTAVHVETTSTQQGEVITGTHMTSLPLNGRSYTDLLALQPGVAPLASGEYITYTNSATSVSGGLDAGGLSINGQRETANGFTVNGADVNESIYQQTSVVPNLDSIAEFRILTSNFDAEYGNYSGGQIMVVTKSGTNQFHGDVFEFLRNDALDSRNFFSPTRGSFKQNQFGATVGGPIRHDKAFFFVDYQGTRNVIGQDTGNILVPSVADRAGDLSDEATHLTGKVAGASWAQMLSQELGYPVAAAEPYYTTGCNSSAQCVFPNATICRSAFSPPVSHLLQYIPMPNSGPYFTTSAYSETLRDDKGGVRVDGSTRFGMLSAYYMVDDYTLVNPYATSSLPGFADQNAGRAQLIDLSDTTSFGGSALNEFRMSFTRNAIFENEPLPGQGTGVTLSSLGFVEGFNTLGIGPEATQYEGVPPIGLNEFGFGVSANTTKQFDNIFQWQDNYSKIIGTHTLKFGGNFHYDQAGLLWPNLTSNGNFGFNGNETGNDFADFLIGAPVFFAQGAPNGFPNRSHYLGLYGQDSWRASRNLTVNYGLRWDVSQFWYNPRNEVDAMIPGEQSVDLPGAPTGLLFPGDPGVPKTVAPTGYHNFGPRIGLAYSPAASGGILKLITGGPGKSSIRLGYGLFYTAIEDLSVQVQTDYPFGLYYVSPVPSLFTTPYVDRGTGHSEGQRFPVVFPPPPSPSHPNNNVNWAQFIPISSNPVVYGGDRLPYSEDYSVSVQRQFGSDTLVSLAFVGAQGHRLLTGLEANPGNPTLCLSVSQPNQVMPGTPTCGPFGENGVYYPVSGGVIKGTRGPFGPLFASNAWYDTMGNSNYNAFETSVRHASGRAEFLASYTYSKAMDNASGLGDQVYPFNYKLTKALSAFDTTNNFVVSYSYTMPFEKLFGHDRLAGGWKLSGTTRFATGFPVTLNEQDDNSLLGTSGSGIGGGVDVPDYTQGNLNFANPRTGRPYFNTSLFSPEALGQFGTANRRFFHGPGLNNFDMALVKNTRLTESKSLEFRAEWFNIFNHAQFMTPNGNINSGTFGLVTSAYAPRIGQLALKLYF
ncbi:MAG TPA: carboxypeptidase regulatory-like domain-containing protein [Terriglobia bacterium]|nr:carboxypeptidase regulatory-like domain-containing protein [Terriglobia bacterium]